MAEAQALQNRGRMQRLHRKVFRGLVLVSAAFAGLFSPWSENIVGLFLGSAYKLAGPVLAIMLLYPVFQTIGQIDGVTLLANGETRAYTAVSTIFMLVSVPVTYLVQAPPNARPLGGFGGGAIGMAIKMVGLALLSVSAQSWVVARKNGWKFDWGFPFVAISTTLFLGYTARSIVALIWHISSGGFLTLFPPFAFCTIMFGAGLSALIWRFPMLIGVEDSEMRQMADGLLHYGPVLAMLRRGRGGG